MTLKKRKTLRTDDCRFSNGIICLKHDGCDTCGWNPAVDSARRLGKMSWRDWLFAGEDGDQHREVKGLVFRAKRAGEKGDGLTEKSGKEA